MEIPMDMFLYDILPRTSLKTVASSRLLSKRINEATYERYFMELFHRKANIVSGLHVLNLKSSKYHTNYFSVDPSSTKLSLRSFLPSNIKIEAATKQGLLLCTDFSSYPNSKYIICKPTTQQWRAIPNPKTRYLTHKCMMFTIGSNPLRYKIVRFSSRNFGGDFIKNKSGCYVAIRCEVFDSKLWTWKCLDQTINLPFREAISYGSMVCISRFLYALTNKNRLFIFDTENESWEFYNLDLDDEAYSNTTVNAIYRLLEYEGKLGLLCRLKNDEFDYYSMQLWVIIKKSGTSWSWSLRKKECLPIISNNERYSSLINFFNNDLAVIMGFYNIIFYDFMTSASKIEVEIYTPMIDQIFLVESDWLPVSL
ncbi:uncharacterized protein LOC133795091 [Humulus lupulus]|uniref:uncharacterized protein LOC133795091 n=1 Tax=Humulus lupulus TaxID=3486 RepID=UPI002B40DE6A|nr:uncharacterized protein LOC133795091 [Humulus lupulus]